MNDRLERLAFRVAPKMMARRYVATHQWAITPDAMEMIATVISAHDAGIRFDAAEAEAKIAAAGGKRASAPGDSGDMAEMDDHEAPTGSKVAVVELRGVLARHMDLMTYYSGGTSTDCFAKEIRMAATDANTRGILIFADTPGGTVDGTQEAAEAVAEVVAGGMPVVVYAEGQLCSGGFWIGSQATKIVSAPFGQIGSLGVVCQHLDVSGADEQDGLKYTYITYPEGGNKAEANPHEPLKDNSRQHLQDLITPAGDAFYAAVAEGRGVNLAKVNTWGKGRVFDSSEALRLGMIDDVTDLDGAFALLDELSGGSPAPKENSMANVDPAEVAAHVKAALPDALAAALPTALGAQLEPLLDKQTKTITAGQTTALADALAPINARLDSAEQETKALRKAIDDSNASSAQRDIEREVQAIADKGGIAPDQVAAQVECLMDMKPESREKQLTLLKARRSTVPTAPANLPSPAESLSSWGDDQAFSGPGGRDSVDASEASIVAKIAAEGISAADRPKFMARYAELKSEVADA